MLRLRLFFYYQSLAFYAIIRPQELLQKENDARQAIATLKYLEAKERILGGMTRRKVSKPPEDD